ncbi:FAD-dependent oxidoreductase [Pontiellaceae bacterium B12227]|nr:FAD-dependent oxidoreductase [Pontiellaceae bacterium B12227]
MTHAEPTDVLIVGAGISGLLCATELQRAGLSVQLVDKGRGVGGRMSRRRKEGAVFDHGAQFFTCRSNHFQSYVDEWLDKGVIREWFRKMPGDTNPEGYPRYCGINGMNDVPKLLAGELVVHAAEQIMQIEYVDEVWIAESAAGNRFSGKELIMTAPLPQSMALIDQGGIQFEERTHHALQSVQYEKGLATMAILSGPSGLPEPGGLKLESDVLCWMADNRMKGISPNHSAITLHATPAFAEAHWDSDDAMRGQLMMDAAGALLKSEVVEFNCHRWGFTTASNPWKELFFHDAGQHILLAGDAFGGNRVEGAALSGLAAAEVLLKANDTSSELC